MTLLKIHYLFGILAVAYLAILLLRTIFVLVFSKRWVKEMRDIEHSGGKTRFERFLMKEFDSIFPFRYLYLSISFAGHALFTLAFGGEKISGLLVVAAAVIQAVSIGMLMLHAKEGEDAGLTLPYFLLHTGGYTAALILIFKAAAVGGSDKFFISAGAVIGVIIQLFGWLFLKNESTTVFTPSSSNSSPKETSYSSEDSDSNDDDQDEESGNDEEDKKEASSSHVRQDKKYTRITDRSGNMIYSIEGDRSSGYIREPYGDIIYKIKYDSVYDAYSKFLFDIRGNELVDGSGRVQYTISDNGVVRGYHGNYVCTLIE